MMKLDTTHAFLKEDVKSYQEVVNKYHEQRLPDSFLRLLLKMHA